MAKLYDLKPGTEICVINGDYNGCIIEENGQKYFLVFEPEKATKHALEKDKNYEIDYDIIKGVHSYYYYKEWIAFNNYIPKSNNFFESHYTKKLDNYEINLNVLKDGKIKLEYYTQDFPVSIASKPFKAETMTT